ncbi:hypothetical protein [Streptomyces sp. NPDC003952]
MAWRDRVRRRAGTTDRAGLGAQASGGSAGPSGSDGSAVPGAGAPAPSVLPGDWDGGWRRTEPQSLTLSGAPLGVSDGLAFRAGLAAWQNPSFDGGMGHALLPTAPTGLVHGMTRPAAPHVTGSGGGPLLLRAVRAEGTGAAADASGPEAPPAPGGSQTLRAAKARNTPEGAAKAHNAASTSRKAPTSRKTPKAPKAPKVPHAAKALETPRALTSPGTPTAPEASAVRPSGPAAPPPPGGATGTGDASERLGSGGRPPSRDLPTTTSPAVLSTPTPAAQRAVAASGAGRSPVAAPIPLVRRIVVVAAGPGARDRSPRGAGAGTVGRTAPGKGTAQPGAPADGTRDVPSGGRQESSSRPVVRSRPVGPLLTVARRVPGGARPVPALRPAAPVVPLQAGAAVADAPEPAEPSRSSTTGAESPDRTVPGPDVRRAATRTALGPPLTELPPSAVPSAGNAPPGPGLPVVQRPAEDTSRSATGVPAPSPDPVSPHRSVARARGGLGAPLSAMPPSARPPGGPAPGPGVRRTPAPPSPAAGGPAPSGSGPTAPTAAGAAAPHAPVLGAADVQRRITHHPVSRGGGSTDRPSGGTSAVPAAGPAMPPVSPSPSPSLSAEATPRAPARRDLVQPDRAPAGPGPVGAPRLAGPTAPAPVVVARAVSGPGAGTPVPAPGPGGDRRGTATPKAANGPSGPVRATAVPAPGSGRRPTAPASGASATRPAAAASGADSRASAAPARRPGTASGPVGRRTLALLSARPLTLSTRAPDGPALSAAPRPVSGPPVVPARWSTAEDTRTPVQRAASASAPVPPFRSAPAPGASGASRAPGTSGSAAPPPSTPRDTAAPVRTTATAYGPPPGDGGAVPYVPAPVGRVPVVRPAPPGRGAPATATGSPARALPVAPSQAPPVADGPPTPLSPAPGTAVPVVRPRAAPSAAPAASGGAASRIQRAPSDAAASPSATPAAAAPAKEVPAHGKRASSPASAATGRNAGRNTGRGAGPAQDPGLDLDDLARRLLDPMARLLRTELRRGRERTGRPYDGRR